MRSIIAASVVLLPLPVVPVTRVNPRCDRAMSLITGGNCSSSKVRIFNLMTRKTIAGAPRWLYTFTRNRDSPGM